MDIRAFFSKRAKVHDQANIADVISERPVEPGEEGTQENASVVDDEQSVSMPAVAEVNANATVPSDLGGKESGPSQPVLSEYPKTVFGKQRRSFSSDYYRSFTFIEYSQSADALFCFPCRHFQCSGGYKDCAFVTNGIRDWKNILYKLQKHSECASHRQCVERWQGYQASKKTGSVAVMLSDSHKALVASNREYAATVVDMLLYLGKQGLSFRGHDESNTSSNRGNFLEMCKWYANRNEAFGARLDCPFNLTSHETQNELLSIAADGVQKAIINSVTENGFFTVLVDEARSFRDEQMCVCVRYAEGLEVRERFLGFIDCSENACAEALYGHIKGFLVKCGLYTLPIVAQGYDGAAVMSGHLNGVQSKLRQDHPSAVYIHCMAHKLNLVLVDACKVNRRAMGFFLTLESLYTFFGQPGTHHAYTNTQKDLGITAELSALSDTRWACRWRNVSAVKSGMKGLLSTLSQLAEPPNRRFVEASGLLAVTKSLDFCASVVAFHQILSVVHVAHKALQGKDATLATAARVVESLTRCLTDMRTEQRWDELWTEVESFCRVAGVPTKEEERPCKRQVKQSVVLNSAVVTSTLGQRECQISSGGGAAKERLARELFYPVLDTLLGECSLRFSSEAMDTARGVSAVLECQPGVYTEKIIHQYAPQLSINPTLALSEMAMVKTMAQSSSIKEQLLAGHYPNFCKLYRLALSMPVGTATCERSFSAMRRVRNWLQSTMTQERFSALSLLNIESDLTENLRAEDIVAEYDSRRQRRIVLH